jgi:hypothetical protein
MTRRVVDIDFQWTTQCYIPEDRTLHNHCCENLKSYNLEEDHCRLTLLTPLRRQHQSAQSARVLRSECINNTM